MVHEFDSFPSGFRSKKSFGFTVVESDGQERVRGSGGGV